MAVGFGAAASCLKRRVGERSQYMINKFLLQMKMARPSEDRQQGARWPKKAVEWVN